MGLEGDREKKRGGGYQPLRVPPAGRAKWFPDLLRGKSSSGGSPRARVVEGQGGWIIEPEEGNTVCCKKRELKGLFSSHGGERIKKGKARVKKKKTPRDESGVLGREGLGVGGRG